MINTKKDPWNVAPVAAANQLLADATRLKLLLLLGGGEANVTELCKRLGLGQPTVSHHLGLLRTAGVVEPRRQGKRVFYRLSDTSPAPGTVRVRAGNASVTVQLW